MVPAQLCRLDICSLLHPRMAEITKIEQYIIDKAKKKRTALKMSQIELSHRLERNSSFVGHVENGVKRAKYNVNHINALAEIFDCSPRDFLPERPL